MVKPLVVCNLVLALFSFAAGGSSRDERPAWDIDLQPFGYGWDHDTSLKFSGRFLVIYPDSHVNTRIVFDYETHKQASEESLRGISLPPWGDPEITRFRKPAPAVNVIGRLGDTLLEQIDGVGWSPGRPEYYLQEPGKQRIAIFQPKCIPPDPKIVGRELVLLHLCSGKNMVVDQSGQKKYSFANLTFADVAPNDRGTRFLTYERKNSLFHQGTYWKRLRVFRSIDGKKLFEYRWRAEGDYTNTDRAALSDDGSWLALVRSGKVLMFALPPPG
jgi:hypothetical protein